MGSSKVKSELLPGYTKVGIVGKGAFGTAILCMRDSDKKEIVIKEVNIMEMPLDERKSALNEVKVLAALHHPNIIRYFGSFEKDGCLMIEMEYADGGTLAQFLDMKYNERKRLKELDLMHLFRQMSSALSYMHKHNILHRDLKTANIFLTKHGTVKVGDFGISKMMTTLAQAQTVVGTPYYLSPEMCEGKDYDEKSDIWALGCVLYEMIELRKPFDATSLPALVKKIVSCDFEPISTGHSKTLQLLVEDILQKNTSSRPTAQMIHDTVIPKIMNELESFHRKRIETEEKGRILKERSVLYELKNFENIASLEPIQLPSVKLTDVATGNDHYLAITEDSKVYSWGDNGCGQLGHTNSSTWTNYPMCINSLTGKNIKQVSAGNRFSAFLTNLGVLMTCGNNKYGCLGHGDWKTISEPRIINRLVSVNIRQISCGTDHVMALTKNGDLYSWGCGRNGRLGLGDEENRCCPTLVTLPDNQKISQVYCGEDGTIAITTGGHLMACGCNESNKLGLSSIFKHCEKSLNFRRIKGINQAIKDVQIGTNHTVLITMTNSIITMGKNKERQLGRDNYRLIDGPKEISFLNNKITMAACGSTYSVVGTVDNIVYFWGTRYNTFSNNESISSSCNKIDINFKSWTQLFRTNKAPMNTGNTSLSSEALHNPTSEIIRQPKPILGLYASPEHIADGELVWLVKLFALNDSVLVWVNTTVPPTTSFEKNWNDWFLDQKNSYWDNYREVRV